MFLEASATLGAVLVFTGAGIFVVERGREAWFWRGAEYAKLSSLRAGFDLRYFEDKLGPPFASRTHDGFQENGFKGRSYWVQTISRDGTVQLYAVTSCDKSFQPTFTAAGTDVEIELNRDRLSEVLPDANLAFDYSIGASAPSLFYEALYGAMHGYYKTTIWGLSSLCGPPKDLDHSMLPRASSGYLSQLNGGQEEFRRRATVNTFAETAPEVDGGLPANFGVSLMESGSRSGSTVGLYRFGNFYIGPDRVMLQGQIP